MDRRSFLLATSATAFAQTREADPLRHILSTADHQRILLKASFHQPVKLPKLRVGGRFVSGVRTDSDGRFWTFDIPGLKPSTDYELQLPGADPWRMRTFPHPSERVSKFRLLIYTCAGGHPVLRGPGGQPRFVPLATRRRMLKRALSFSPDAVVANGDHIYWDQLTSGGRSQGRSKEGLEYAGEFNRSAPVLGTPNEAVLHRAVGPQIADLYGTMFRGVPVFFITDDHDHFDNDEADDRYVSFPPDAFMMRAARATRRLYYPEFLPDANRPGGLAGSFAPDTPPGTAEAFGTLRYGRLAELLLYDCRRYLTLSGPTATFIPRETEAWITARLQQPGVDHVVQAPSVPVGWSAGKWGDWYPDILDAQGKLGTKRPKPYWQTGWRAQHDRLVDAASQRPDSAPLFLCGDLHAFGLGEIRTRAKTVTTALTGPVSTGPTGWPSAARGTPPQTPKELAIDEKIPAMEKLGFTIADFTPESVNLRFFAWTADQPESALDTLEPFHTAQLPRA